MLETPRPRNLPLAAARRCAQIALIVSPLRWHEIVSQHRVPDVYTDYTDILLNAGDIFVVATLMFAMLWLAKSRPVKWPTPRLLPVACLAVFAVALVTSTLLSFDPVVAGQHALRMTLLAGWAWFVCRQMSDLSWWVIPAVLLLVTESGVAMAQALLQHQVGLQHLGEALLDPGQSGISVVLHDNARWLRAYGLADHPNILGGGISITLLMLWASIGSAASHSGTPPNPQASTSLRGLETIGNLMRLSTLAAGSAALYLTFSRSAWLGFAVGLGTLMVTSARFGIQSVGRFKMPLLLSGLAIGACILATSNLVLSRLDSQSTLGQSAPVLERGFLIERTLDVAMLHPLVGVGVNNLPLMLRMLFPFFPVVYAPAHLVQLTAAAEIGIPGALAFTLLWVWPFIVALRSPGRTGRGGWALALLACLTVISLLDYYLWTYPPGRMWLALVLGLSYSKQGTA